MLPSMDVDDELTSTCAPLRGVIYYLSSRFTKDIENRQRSVCCIKLFIKLKTKIFWKVKEKASEKRKVKKSWKTWCVQTLTLFIHLCDIRIPSIFLNLSHVLVFYVTQMLKQPHWLIPFNGFSGSKDRQQRYTLRHGDWYKWVVNTVDTSFFHNARI